MLFLLISCNAPIQDDSSAMLCNGLEELCDKPLNEVAFLRTHNSHASQERGYTSFSMNHFLAIPTQLNDGVRSLNMDLYDVDGELLFCHGFCDLGSQPAEDLVTEIEDFLIANPHEILLLDLQDESNGRAAEAFSSLEPFFFNLDTPNAWPTLSEMIDVDQRVLLFGERNDSDPSWLQDKDTWIYSNGWHYEAPEELDCTLRGSVVDNGLYEVTHVLTSPLAHPDLAEEINHQPLIGEHLQQCLNEVGFVNMLSVDFYSIGDGLEVIKALNKGLPVVE